MFECHNCFSSEAASSPYQYRVNMRLGGKVKDGEKGLKNLDLMVMGQGQRLIDGCL